MFNRGPTTDPPGQRLFLRRYADPKLFGVGTLQPLPQILPIGNADTAESNVALNIMSPQDLAASYLSLEVHHDIGLVINNLDCKPVFGIVDGESLVSDLLAGLQQRRLIDAAGGDQYSFVLEYGVPVDVISQLSR